MEILLISLWSPKKGGIVTHVENLVKRSKNRFTILTYNSHEETRDVLRVRYINVPILRALTFTLFGLFKALKREHSLIHAHYTIPQGFLGVLLKKFRRKPLVVTVHGSDITVLGKNPLTKPIVKYTLNNADKIIVVSRFLKNEIEKLGIGGGEVKVIYNGISFKNVEKSEPKEKTIVFIGSLVWQKGVDILLRSFIDVKKTFPDAKLTIVGDGNKRGSLEKLAKELNLKDVHFFGYRRDMENVLKEASLLVLPSREEGLGIVLLEAMNFGVPVVATKVGGIREIVKDDHNGVLVKPEAPEALAQGMIKILKDEKFREDMIKNGKIFVKDFSWDRIVKEIDAVYESVGGYSQ